MGVRAFWWPPQPGFGAGLLPIHSSLRAPFEWFADPAMVIGPEGATDVQVGSREDRTEEDGREHDFGHFAVRSRPCPHAGRSRSGPPNPLCPHPLALPDPAL